jgi:hypothetical protein
MPDASGHGVLFVEGKDDCHALIQLFVRHSIVLDENDGPVLLKHVGSDSAVVNAITAAVKGSGKHPVGFVVDSDETVQKRWGQIRAKLAVVGVTLPSPASLWSDELPTDGFIARSGTYDRSVGVWIMPNNRTDYGKIEDLLTTLVPTGDALFELAKRATTQALAISSTRPRENPAIQSKDERKGQLHSWLAWQEEPGMSYGHALRRKYFDHESTVATAFVAWFKKLYGLP